jgi:LPXTG-motif cell wall-anchored protein
MAEDETATYRVTGTGFDSGDQTFTHDCVAAESTTTTTVPDTVQGTEVVRATTLPRTGSGSTLPMSTTAGLLLMAGGLLLALANRPMPATASTSTRSRGR